MLRRDINQAASHSSNTLIFLFRVLQVSANIRQTAVLYWDVVGGELQRIWVQAVNGMAQKLQSFSIMILNTFKDTTCWYFIAYSLNKQPKLFSNLDTAHCSQVLTVWWQMRSFHRIWQVKKKTSLLSKSNKQNFYLKQNDKQAQKEK